MPSQGKKERRVLCPYCSGEFAEGYLWLHKRDFCPMRPERQNNISIPPGIAGAIATGTMHGQQHIGATAAFPINNQFSNIIPINLMEEYDNMVKVMKKRQEEEEEEYQCGGCKATFNAAKEPKYCPECGVAF